MLQPLLPLVQGKINTTRATDRSGSVSPVPLLYFPLLPQLFVLGLGKLDRPGGIL